MTSTQKISRLPTLLPILAWLSTALRKRLPRTLFYFSVASLLSAKSDYAVGQTGTVTRPNAPMDAGITLQSAAEATLTKNPQLLLTRAQMDLAEAQRMLSSSVFNPKLQGQLTHTWTTQPLTVYQAASYQTATFSGTFERAAIILLTSDVNKLLRNGIGIGGHFELQRQLDNIVSPNGNNFSALSLAGSIPLLRNRGSRVVDAQEIAARQEVNATRSDTGQEASQLLNSLASSYWTLVAGQKNLTILLASEARARIYLSNVQTLVGADQAPRGDLSQVEANLATRTSQRIAAEQAVAAAEQQLAFNIGFSLADLRTISMHALDDFPVPPEATTLSAKIMDPTFTITTALNIREDYLAALQRVSEQETLEMGARNGMLPQLDLVGSAGYAGLQSGRTFANFFSASTTGVNGLNAQVQLTYSFPVGNEAAKSYLLRTRTALRQTQLRAEQLRQEISSEVRTSQAALLHSSQQVFETARAVRASQAALDGEREKYRVGMGSIVDLVTVEDRLNAALSDQVSAQETFALAIAQLRFATGTFVDHKGDKITQMAHAFDAIPPSD